MKPEAESQPGSEAGAGTTGGGAKGGEPVPGARPPGPGEGWPAPPVSRSGWVSAPAAGPRTRAARARTAGVRGVGEPLEQ